MESVEELKEWCQTEIFLPTVWYFLEGYLWPQQASENAKPQERGAGFSTIVAIIAAKVRRKCSRDLTSDRHVDRSRWDVDIWNASALKRIFDEDVADAEGLWGWEHESDERRSAVLYVLWSLFIRECSTSRLHRIWPLLGISSEKGEELREKFRI